MERTYRGTAGGALLLIVGGGSGSFPGAGGGGWGLSARLGGLRLRVLVLFGQGEQVTEPAAGSDFISTCGDVTNTDSVCCGGVLPHLVGFITARLDMLQGLKDRSLGED